jgi:cytochrome c553
MKKTVLLIVSIVFIFSCKQKTNTDADYSKKSTKKEISQHEGEKLLKQQCYVCHNPKASHDSRIAPPMVAIKAHYIDSNTTKEEFTEEFVNFIKKPTKEKAKLKGAVKRFGVMPYQYYKENHLKKIAEYLYDYQIEEPDWFKEHWQEKKGISNYNEGKKSTVQNAEKSNEEIGLEFALGTKKVLGKNLMGTIQNKGTLAALEFCNEKAIHLTDSMATKYNASIKRVSDKPRNPENAANQREIEIIEMYKKALNDSLDINPITETKNEQNQFYYPIITNGMCLQCHGKPEEQIKPEILNTLSELYPQDKATGYTENEIRGIWSITFKK